MKIERINENKIKVMIDKEEAEEWNISLKSISENTPEVQDMFWSAIQQAQKDVDFMIDGAKLFVEAVPETPEGFAMLITKVTSDEELSEAIHKSGYKGKVRQTELKIKRRMMQRKSLDKYIYKFENFDTLCVAAKEIYSFFDGKSSVYKFGERFYLILTPNSDAAFFEV